MEVSTKQIDGIMQQIGRVKNLLPDERDLGKAIERLDVIEHVNSSDFAQMVVNFSPLQYSACQQILKREGKNITKEAVERMEQQYQRMKAHDFTEEDLKDFKEINDIFEQKVNQLGVKGQVENLSLERQGVSRLFSEFQAELKDKGIFQKVKSFIENKFGIDISNPSSLFSAMAKKLKPSGGNEVQAKKDSQMDVGLPAKTELSALLIGSSMLASVGPFLPIIGPAYILYKLDPLQDQSKAVGTVYNLLDENTKTVRNNTVTDPNQKGCHAEALKDRRQNSQKGSIVGF